MFNPTPSSPNVAEKKVCLCMIVKNESRIIARCLDAAKSIIDYVSICDTGSTDGTREIIEDWCAEHGIPGTVHFEPFRNFGYNRSLSASLAKKTYPEADYLLLLDADQTLQVDSRFDKRRLQHDQYIVRQYNHQMWYWNTRLIKTLLPWQCIGVTHEYWDIDRSRLHADYSESKGKLDHLIIVDLEDGDNKRDKYERDMRLLLEELQNPSIPRGLKTRYIFYLAQTYFCLDKIEEAIQWYKKRVSAGGWTEEVFYSLLQIGRGYEKLANHVSALRGETIKESVEHRSAMAFSVIDRLNRQEEEYAALAALYYVQAWECHPARAEPLYHLAKMFRIRSKHRLGLMYALQGKEIPLPENDVLFVDYRVYKYLLDYEIALCAYHIDHKRLLGHDAAARLQSNTEHLPAHIARSVDIIAKYYS